MENHLGLESWCVHHVYRHAHNIILASSRRHPKASREASGGDKQPSAGGHGSKCAPQQPFALSLVKYLNCAILINPDVVTFWNCRRRLFEKNRLKIRQEFQFSTIVLSKKPKSNEAFAYRRWLYSFQSHESNDWARELSLCERCASKSLSNYQAWCHRQWVLQKAPFMLQYELAVTERFIRRHIADYNAYHHRQFVLRKLFEFGHVQSMDSRKSADDHRSLWKLLASVGVVDADCSASLANVILSPDLSRDSPQIQTLLFCLNVAAGDLELVEELRDLFGHREAFDCHRKATIKFIFDKLTEWSTDGAMSATNAGDAQPKRTVNRNIVDAFKRHEMDNGNELHRKWCETFLRS